MEQSDFLQRQLDLLGRILGKALTDLLGIKNSSQIIEEFETIHQIVTNESLWLRRVVGGLSSV